MRLEEQNKNAKFTQVQKTKYDTESQRHMANEAFTLINRWINIFVSFFRNIEILEKFLTGERDVVEQKDDENNLS